MIHYCIIIVVICRKIGVVVAHVVSIIECCYYVDVIESVDMVHMVQMTEGVDCLHGFEGVHDVQCDRSRGDGRRVMGSVGEI